MKSSGAKKIVITGASGHIGSVLTPYLVGRYELVLVDIDNPASAFFQLFVRCDISDIQALRVPCEGADCIIHLAADSQATAPWESLLPTNIVGAYNVYKVAHDTGCKRVIFASSIHTILGYSKRLPINACMAVRPSNLYGVSKAWGEVLGRFYADEKGLSCICLRLGWVKSETLGPNEPGSEEVLTYKDLSQLFSASIDAPDDLRFGIFHGISEKRWKLYDLSETTSGRTYTLRDGYLSGHQRIQLVLKRLINELLP